MSEPFLQEDAGAGDGKLEGAELLLYGLDQLGHGLAIGDVGGAKVERGRTGFRAGGELGQASGIAGDGDHGAAFAEIVSRELAAHDPRRHP